MATQKSNNSKKGVSRSTAAPKGQKASENSTPSKGAASSATLGKNKKQVQSGDDRTMKIIIGLIFIVLGVFLFAAVEFQAAGQLGNIVGQYLKGTMGLVGIIFPFYLILIGILMIMDKTVRFSMVTFVLGFAILLLLCVINSGRFIDPAKIVFNAKDFFNKGVDLRSGGLFGMGLGSFLVKYIGKVGLYSVGIGGTILCTFLLLKDTPAKKLVNHLRLRSQERKIERSEIKAEREKEKEERKKEKEKIKENQKKINEIKEDQKRKRLEAKERNARELEQSQNGDMEGWPVLIPKGHDALDDYDSTKFDKGIPLDAKTERIIHVMNEESNIQTEVPENTIRINSASGLGLEEQRVAKPGYGLGYDEYDSRADGVKIVNSQQTARSQQTRTNAGGSGQDLGIPKAEPKQAARTSASSGTSGISGAAGAAATSAGVAASTQGGSAKPLEGPAASTDRLSKKDAREAMLDASEFNKVKKNTRYKKPTIDLLKYVSSNTDLSKTNSELKEKADLLERTLQSFNVDAKVVQVTQGPAVTRYEIQPNVGVKVNKIVSLADDIALNLRARSIRIEAPIPGKAAVGIEVENDNVNMVTIRELIDSKEFKQAKSKISFGVGRDIAGKAIVGDLKSMPHLLIAGSTGSGKSVCINCIITSILYKANLDEVKFVLIDPKVVELGDYNGIPHLLIPVVTDATKAAAALNWAVAEMTNRYKLFADNHVRDLETYNDHLRANGEETLPQIVIIIDELADLMMAAPSQVEESICRLAQLARAAGMHLIVATQRPSVDVITGLIKANIPSRIAFAVASQFDSRTILDMGGAEKLVGKGDMLYNPLGMGKPIRVQGCFISDEEIHRVIDFVKNQQDAEYSSEVLDTINSGNTQSGSESVDELFDDAVEFVIGAGKASTSLIQRRFRIGYNRAANIIDEMEARGIIGPADGSKPRQVLATSAPTRDDAPMAEEAPEAVPQAEVISETASEPVSEHVSDEPVNAASNNSYNQEAPSQAPPERVSYQGYQEVSDEEEVNQDIKDLFKDLDTLR